MPTEVPIFKCPACDEEIAHEYETITGLMPDVFFGTSPGAVEFSSKRYTLEWSLK